MKILCLNGPNINRLGKREKEAYGTFTLEELETDLQKSAEANGVTLECRQSNQEGELIDWLHSSEEEGVNGIILNAAAYTHTSVAIRDAIAAITVPVIEVHISNVYKREEFRHHSYIAPVAAGQIAGLGKDVYELALQAFILQGKREQT